jgi:hypothetical protein
MAFGDFTVTRASTKLRIGSNGLYGSVANNVPAFEFNTDGTYRGLLVEPGATNLLLRSQEFNTTWGKTDITVTDNSIVAPDGATTADTITEGTAGTAFLSQTVTVSAGATATASIYVKVGTTNDFIRIAISQSGTFANNVVTWFRFSTGVLSGTTNSGTGTGATASVEALINGWYRISLTGAIPAVTSYVLSVNSTSASGSTTRVNNSVYYLWQAQLETGSVATSPIVTTAGTASRVADVVTLTSASSVIGQSAGWGSVEIEMRDAGINRGIFALSDGTNDNRFALQVGGAGTIELRIVAGTVLQGATAGQALTTGLQKWAYRYSSSSVNLSKNGSTVASLGAITVPATSQVRLGLIAAGTGNQFNGWIRSLALGATDITEATLNSLTA